MLLYFETFTTKRQNDTVIVTVPRTHRYHVPCTTYHVPQTYHKHRGTCILLHILLHMYSCILLYTAPVIDLWFWPDGQPKLTCGLLLSAVVTIFAHDMYPGMYTLLYTCAFQLLQMNSLTHIRSIKNILRIIFYRSTCTGCTIRYHGRNHNFTSFYY